jgi:hypothetical protein
MPAAKTKRPQRKSSNQSETMKTIYIGGDGG